MNLRDSFAELREDEQRRTPAYRIAAPSPSRLRWLRPAAAFVVFAIVVVLALRPRHVTFTNDDRAAARAIAEWRPRTDFLLRMPSTGVSR
ncbi:MAG TPA: hypothetical protein VI670_20000 [Thermoanaerobaculia bacterium]|jgi:hypothetical protein